MSTPADEYIERYGKIFETGHFPDKSFSMTPEELAAAVADFRPCLVDLEHTPTLLDGKLGELRSVSVAPDGRSLFGTVALPGWLDGLLADGQRKVSCTWDRATKRLRGLALVRTPRISDAALLSAFSVAHPDEAAALFADRTWQGQSVLQSVHDSVAAAGAVCSKDKSRTGPKVPFHTADELKAMQDVHDLVVSRGARCNVMGDGGKADMAKLTKAERDKLPDSDFAGPDRTFPVTDQDDVDSAARLIGKAADPDAVKARIIKIAKRKGLKIPDAWADDVGMGDDGTAGDADDPADPADPARTATFAPRKLHDDHTAHMQAHHDLSARHAPSLCLGGRGAGNGTAGMGGAAAFADKTKQVKALKLMHDMAVEHGATCPGRAAMSRGDAPPNGPGRARGRTVTFVDRLKKFMGLGPDVDLDITEDQARPMVAVFAGVPAGAPAAHEGGTAAGGKADPPAPAPVVSFADSEEGRAMLAKIAALEASDAAKTAALKAAADQLEADRRDRIDREAAAFAEALVRDKRAFPAERDFVAAEFAEAADADHTDAKPVTFSVGGQPRQGTRVERLKAKYAARPQHALFDAMITTDALPPEARALFNGGAADAPPSEERLRTLRGYAETGRLINAEAAGNGR